jgi:hypothetical protein
MSLAVAAPAEMAEEEAGEPPSVAWISAETAASPATEDPLPLPRGIVPRRRAG